MQACGSQLPALRTLGMAAGLQAQTASKLTAAKCHFPSVTFVMEKKHATFLNHTSQIYLLCCHSAWHSCICCVFQKMHGICRALVGLCRAPVLWSGLALRASCIQASAVIAWLTMSGLPLPSCAAGVAKEACAAFACVTRNINGQRHTLWAFLGACDCCSPIPHLHHLV